MSSFKKRLRLKFEIQRCLLTDRWVRTRVPVPEPNTDKWLVLRLDAIGDYILFRSFLEKFRKSQVTHDKKITLLGNVIWKSLALRWDTSLADEFIWLDRKKFYQKPSYRFALQKRLRQAGFGTVVNTSFSRYLLFDDAIVGTCGAPERIGSIGDTSNTILKEKQRADRYYTKLLPASPNLMFEFDRHQEFFESLLPDVAVPRFTPPETFPVARGRAYLACFFGASDKYRCWPTENFIEIAQKAHQSYGLEILLLGGTREISDTKKIEDTLRNQHIPVRNEVAKTNIPQLTERIAHADMLISNETVAIHLGALYQIPSICISSGRHYGRFNPYPAILSQEIDYLYPPKVEDYLAAGNEVTRATFFHDKGDQINEVSTERAWELMQKKMQDNYGAS